jgi:hypothetical protein
MCFFLSPFVADEPFVCILLALDIIIRVPVRLHYHFFGYHIKFSSRLRLRREDSLRQEVQSFHSKRILNECTLQSRCKGKTITIVVFLLEIPSKSRSEILDQHFQGTSVADSCR